MADMNEETVEIEVESSETIITELHNVISGNDGDDASETTEEGVVIDHEAELKEMEEAQMDKGDTDKDLKSEDDESISKEATKLQEEDKEYVKDEPSMEVTPVRRSSRLKDKPGLSEMLQIYNRKKDADESFSYKSAIEDTKIETEADDDDIAFPEPKISPQRKKIKQGRRLKTSAAKTNADLKVIAEMLEDFDENQGYKINYANMTYRGKRNHALKQGMEIEDYTNNLFTGFTNGKVKTKPPRAVGFPVEAPRSQKNAKFRKVYDVIPSLRSVSPPRFTTDGVPKTRLDFEKIGVKKLGKVVGNPYSRHNKRRNHLLYGNTITKDSENEKIQALDKELKRVIEEQTGIERKSSYVNRPVLSAVKKKLGIKSRSTKQRSSFDDDMIDIETVDESNGDSSKSVKKRLGRKPGRTTLECEFCGYKTTHSGHMKVHIVSVHQQLRKYKCQYEGCKYATSRKGTMVRHEKCVHRKDLLYRCPRPNCDFESAWTKSLERHIITVHEQLRPWKCGTCGFTAGQQYTLQIHIESVHKKSKNIKCAFCDFRANTRCIVKNHIVQRHAEKIAEATQMTKVS